MMLEQRDIVLLRFPFSDLGGSKVRPALVISKDEYNAKTQDFIAVAITSNLKTRGPSILLTNYDLEKGRLIVDSKIKPGKIFSASKKLIRMSIGRVVCSIILKIRSIPAESQRNSTRGFTTRTNFVSILATLCCISKLCYNLSAGSKLKFTRMF
jgi:mRNA interferase MazF